MRVLLYDLRKKVSLFFLKLSLRLNLHNISAIIFFLNIRKISTTKNQNKKFKKILYFSKSGGNHDLLTAFSNYKNNLKNNIILYWIPRSFVKTVYFYYFKTNYKKDYFTKPINSIELLRKKLYVENLKKIFNALNKFIKLDGLISFNVFYYAEKYIEEVCIELGLKFIVLHKESALSPKEEEYFTKGYSKYNNKSLATKISVYSESQKKILINSKIASNKQIVITGCARSDYSFKLRKIEPNENSIVYYMIETNRFSITKFQRKMGISKSNWKKLHDQTLKYLFEYSKINPRVKITLKGKTGVHTKNEFKDKNLPKNIRYIYGGTGEKLLKDSKVVIGFNSTIVFEAIASNRGLIVPNFNLENTSRKKRLLHQINNKKYLVNSKKEFFNKLNFYLRNKYKDASLSSKDKLILNYYIGNIDGNAGERVRKFISQLF